MHEVTSAYHNLHAAISSLQAALADTKAHEQHYQKKYLPTLLVQQHLHRQHTVLISFHSQYMSLLKSMLMFENIKKISRFIAATALNFVWQRMSIMNHKKSYYWKRAYFFSTSYHPSAMAHARAQRNDTFHHGAAITHNNCHTITTTGVLRIKDSSRVGSLVAGTVQQILVKENQHVSKGQLLAILDNGKADTSIRATRGALVRAEADADYQKTVYEREKLSLIKDTGPHKILNHMSEHCVLHRGH